MPRGSQGPPTHAGNIKEIQRSQNTVDGGSLAGGLRMKDAWAAMFRAAVSNLQIGKLGSRSREEEERPRRAQRLREERMREAFSV